jgi:PEP-CTERM motif
MKRIIFALMVLGLAVGRVGLVQAAPITTLFNTGVDASGVALPDGTIGDPHYSLVSVPGGTTDILVRTVPPVYPIPPYFYGGTSSAWIGPNNSPSLDGPVGVYDYQTTFNLAGFNPSTAAISGGWSTDNIGVGIYLNGVDTGNPGTAFNQFQIGYVPFSITSGFVSGLNTLDFFVNNAAGPTALRVEMTGAAAVAAVPEPETYAMLLAGLGLIGFIAYRRKSDSSIMLGTA